MVPVRFPKQSGKATRIRLLGFKSPEIRAFPRSWLTFFGRAPADAPEGRRAGRHGGRISGVRFPPDSEAEAAVEVQNALDVRDAFELAGSRSR